MRGSSVQPKGPAPPPPAPFLNPYHKFCREGKQWRALPEAERLEYKYKRAKPMSEVLETALEIMTEEEATEVLGGGPSAEDRSPPPLLPPLCVVRCGNQRIRWLVIYYPYTIGFKEGTLYEFADP